MAVLYFLNRGQEVRRAKTARRTSTLGKHLSGLKRLILETAVNAEIIVTEQGLADLRGLTACERAEFLIENCAHPKFREELRAYLRSARANSKALHGIL